jgi:adenylate cyclase
MRSLTRPNVISILYVCAFVLCFLLGFFLVDLPHGPEHWSADLRTAWLSTRPTTQHPRIALIYVSDTTLEQSPYLSPVDRKVLSEILRAVDAAGPKAIGLDFIFDRATEPEKDEQLIQSIRQAHAPVVLGALDERNGPASSEETFQATFLARSGRPAGHLYFDEHQSPIVISDHVIRNIAPDSKARVPRPSFAEMLARADGETFRPRSDYISWLLPPTDGAQTFLELPAELLVPGSIVSLPLKSLLQDRIVLIGGNFSDRDQHLTPLSVWNGGRFTGVFVHAQILAQYLAHRSILVLGLSTPGRHRRGSRRIRLFYWAS